MTRSNTVRISDEEKQQLDRIRQQKFSDTTSYGEIIGQLCNKAQTGEEKTEILVAGEGTERMYGYNNSINSTKVNVETKAIRDGSEIRGYSPDLIVLVTDVDDGIMEDIIQPMVQTGTRIVELV